MVAQHLLALEQIPELLQNSVGLPTTLAQVQKAAADQAKARKARDLKNGAGKNQQQQVTATTHSQQNNKEVVAALKGLENRVEDQSAKLIAAAAAALSTKEAPSTKEATTSAAKQLKVPPHSCVLFQVCLL